MDATVVKGLVQTLNLDTLQFKPLTEEFVDGVRICTLSNNTENLKGVEHFPYLKVLRCAGNRLTSINITKKLVRNANSQVPLTLLNETHGSQSSVF